MDLFFFFVYELMLRINNIYYSLVVIEVKFLGYRFEFYNLIFLVFFLSIRFVDKDGGI